MSKLVLLMENNSIVAVNKPCNVLSVPGKSDTDTSANFDFHSNIGIVKAVECCSEQTQNQNHDNSSSSIPSSDPASSVQRKGSRHEQWKKALVSLLSSPRIPSNLPESAIKALEAMIANESIPRKERAFDSCLQRGCKNSVPAETRTLLWKLLVQEDEELQKLQNIDKVIEPNMADLVRAHCQGPVFTVHRLDMETSGVLVFAKTSSACADLNAQFRDKTVRKSYIALVRGKVDKRIGERFTISAPLRPDLTRRPYQIIDFNEGKGKECITEAEVLRYIEEEHDVFTLMHLEPLTGRTHQLRVHMAYIGHAIIGDSLYDSRESVTGLSMEIDSKSEQSNAKRQKIFGRNISKENRLCLHAYQLIFRDPETQQMLSIEATLQQSFLNFEINFDICQKTKTTIIIKPKNDES